MWWRIFLFFMFWALGAAVVTALQGDLVWTFINLALAVVCVAGVVHARREP